MCVCVCMSYYITLNIHYILLLILFIYLMTAAHEGIATGGQIRGVGESDQQALSK